MRHLLATILLGLTFATYPLVFASPAAAALPSCPSQAHHDNVNDNWWPSDDQVTGFRAEITLRTTSQLCSDGGNGVSGNVGEWVGIDNVAGTKITQIGWFHDRVDGVSHFYRFWAINGGGVNAYKEGDPGGTTIFYKVQAVLEGDSWVLVPFDCGGSDWSTCSPKTYNEPMYSSSYGLVDQETNIGGSACTAIFGGSADAAVTYDEIMGLHDFGSAWQGRSLYQRSATCSHYREHDYSNVDFFTWDDRN